ncbi:MAG: TolC family protein, partial [Bryobacteraceae bacterium]
MQIGAQEPFVQRAQTPALWRPYLPPTVPPVTLTNSERLRSLIRAGRLYLTLQDAIALAIENNLDLQVDRYGPLSAQWALERAEGGGPLRGVTQGNSVTSTVTGGQGVQGAIQSAGLTQANGNNTNSSNAGTVTQIGPITPNLDPVFQNTDAWSHQSVLQPNSSIAGTAALIDGKHNFNAQVQQGLLSGGYVQVSAQENYLTENSPTDVLNPSFAPIGQIYVRHSLLNGFGTGVNGRFIRVARKQVTSSDVTFRSQLLNVVADVVNAYWDLVADRLDLKAKQQARDFSGQFYQDTQRQIQLGTVAKVDLYQAEAEVSTRRQELAISESNLRQQEITLKNLMSRNGSEDPELETAALVPLDDIQVPAIDNLPPLRQLVATALANRPDIELDKINNEVQEISAIGTKNGVLPTLGGIGQFTNRAESGAPNPLSQETPIAGLVGGFGNALGQVFRGAYSSSSGSIYFQGTIHNRLNQGDYGVDQLQLRQGDLIERRNRNQLVVDISNQVIALTQARARYENAAASRALQQDLLDKERQKFSLGGSTIDLVIAAQRSLVSAQYLEVSALGTYSRARVALDQVLGLTLQKNNV